MKAQSPLLGFNNNVKHKGRVFHIQTEDSGARHPHIITHLFADGGRILKTTKTSYAEHVGADGMAETVRSMMKEQHKAMFIALRDGDFDHLFEDTAVKVSGTGAIAPTMPAPPSEVRAAAAAVAAPAPSPKFEPPKRASVVAPNAGREVSPTAATVTSLETAGAPPPPHAVAATPGAATLGSGPSVDVDLDALERAAAEAQTPYFQQIHDLPPPPAAVLGKKRTSDVPGATAGSYRSVTPGSTGQPHIVTPPPAPPVDKVEKQPADRPRTAQQPSAGRYAPSRPAAIFATTRPAEGASIFGEDLISEKSLDEVILSYLAEDLDSQPPKK